MEKMKILAFTKYSYAGPSSRYRFYNYKDCFKKEGIELIIKPLFTKKYFVAKGKIPKALIVLKAYISRFFLLLKLLLFKDYEIVLIEYELFPYFFAIFERLLRARGIKYIVDYDDAIFHKYDLSKNRLIRFFLKDKIAKVIKSANLVIVCNDYLKDYAKKYNSNLLQLPTVVLLDRYKAVLNSFKKESDKFIIGWIGSKTTSIYILEILPVIEEFVKKYSDVEFNLIGFDKNLLSSDELKRYHINIIPWSEESEIKEICKFDVGIMPLHDDAWSRGKCGFKLVQYMSCGKPLIASPVGINCNIIEDGVNGFLVKSHKEWFNAFEILHNDKNLRDKMSKENFLRVEQKFSYNKNCKMYIDAIEEIKDE